MIHTTADATRTLEGPGAIFVDPAAYADPVRWHATAAELRRHAPVHFVDIDGFPPFHAVTRHADVMAIERQPDVFTNGLTSVLLDDATLHAQEQLGPGLRTLINMDGDDHRDHRATTAPWFRPASIRTLTDRIDALAEATVDHMIEAGPSCDFATDVALRYPLRVIMSILGVPEHDEPRMLQLTQELFGANDPEFSRGATTEHTVSVIKDFFRYFRGIVDDRRRHPTDDLATVIANARINDARMGTFETISYFVLIATAGHDTTSTAITGGLDALLDHPREHQRLRDDPALLVNGVDEMIRYVSPVRHFMRTAQHDATVNGHDFHAGDWVLLSYASANRDENVFPDPHRFDVTRANASAHLAFGFGVHFCLGAQLARLEMRALFQALLRRVGHIERLGPTEHSRATHVGGPKHVPIRFST